MSGSSSVGCRKRRVIPEITSGQTEEVRAAAAIAVAAAAAAAAAATTAAQGIIGMKCGNKSGNAVSWHSDLQRRREKKKKE